MKFFATDQFPLELPPNHPFPAAKYTALRERIEAAPWFVGHEMLIPESVSESLLRAVHDEDYVTRVLTGNLSAEEQRRIGFPWSDSLVRRSRHSVAGTVAAAHAAVIEGEQRAMNLAGGTHHAYPDHGEGYCVFNDIALAIASLRQLGNADRVAIIDADVHQGNGTAVMFASDPTVFTFSVHGDRNYPIRKEISSLDIALPDNANTEQYLAAVGEGLRQAIDQFQPGVVFYIAGADPYEGDRFGRMLVTKAGLAERDRRVIAAVAHRPLVVVLGGGYAPEVTAIVDIHTETARQLATTPLAK
jgi:acetoin utilization deacetylase AcuC-like enzyme